MASRYFVETPVVGDTAVLSDAEAHHLARVMRAGVGDRLVLFDGTGWEYNAEIRRIGKQTVELAVLSRGQVDRELPQTVHLGVALPKGDRQGWLIEKSVELGIASLTPLRTERSVAQPVEKALSRLRRGVIEASKQCGRNRLMEIHEPQAWPPFVQQLCLGSMRGWVAHPGGQPAPRVLNELHSSPGRPEDTWLAIGPEGGFSEDEIQLALAAGWQTIDLGPRILRVETAAVFLAALITLSGTSQHD